MRSLEDELMRRITLIVFLLYILSCQKLTDPFENKSESFNYRAYQIPGCAGPASLFRNSISEDKCFSYSFEDTLKIDLCVPANCCPDSNRFTYATDINNHVISFAVVDTAANLCRCMCTYRIHADFIGLTYQEYVFICIYKNEILYSEVIKPHFSVLKPL